MFLISTLVGELYSVRYTRSTIKGHLYDLFIKGASLWEKVSYKLAHSLLCNFWTYLGYLGGIFSDSIIQTLGLLHTGERHWTLESSSRVKDNNQDILCSPIEIKSSHYYMNVKQRPTMWIWENLLEASHMILEVIIISISILVHQVKHDIFIHLDSNIKKRYIAHFSQLRQSLSKMTYTKTMVN